MRIEVDGQHFDVPDDATTEEIDQITKPQAAPHESPRRKMAGALNKLLPGVPESSEQAIGMGMGMSMPSPIPLIKGFLPKSTGAMGEMADPVMQQIGRVNAASTPAGATTNRLPALPKALEWILPSKATKIYALLRKATETAAERSADPYPSEGAAVPYQRPPTSVLPQATAQTDPALQAAAAASRARVMANAERMRMAPEAVPPTPEASAAAAPSPAATPTASATPAAVVNPFESAARSTKVAELVKAVDANAGMHLGVDMRDPRAAEALATLPATWWEGMAQASGVNRPSQETINQALEFFRDRAAQGVPKLAAQ